MDIGSNIGYMSTFMASLGSHVVSIEPQFDLVEAFKKTVIVNGWRHRVRVAPGFATFDDSLTSQTRGMGGAWRLNFGGKVTFWDAPYVDVGSFLKDETYDFVKVDTDSVDGEILQGIIDMVKKMKPRFAQSSPNSPELPTRSLNNSSSSGTPFTG